MWCCGAVVAAVGWAALGWAGPGLGQVPGAVPVHVLSLELDSLAAGRVHRLWVKVSEDGLGRPVEVPVLVARGTTPGPTLGLVAALHGNELNGMAVIHRVFEGLEVSFLRGTLVGVTAANVPAVLRHQRRFLDGEDLNRSFPGKPSGSVSAQYVHSLFERVVSKVDFLIDMHTASFGRENTFYVRADMTNPTTAAMAHRQGADIVLHSLGPSVGVGPSAGVGSVGEGTSGAILRQVAEKNGVHSVTVEYGNPQVHQSEIVGRGAEGVWRQMVAMGMVRRHVPSSPPGVLCRQSAWIHTDVGGLLEVLVPLGATVRGGEDIAVVRSVFGDELRRYQAPEPGIVIGREVNPVQMKGGRILHLGRMGSP